MKDRFGVHIREGDSVVYAASGGDSRVQIGKGYVDSFTPKRVRCRLTYDTNDKPDSKTWLKAIQPSSLVVVAANTYNMEDVDG